MRSSVASVALIALAACRDEPVVRCDTSGAACQPLAEVLRGVARQRGAVQWSIDSLRLSIDTAWTVNLLLRSGSADTSIVTPQGMTCDNFVSLGIWDNEALIGPPLQRVPAERWGDDCYDASNPPLVLVPGRTLYFIPFQEAKIDPARLRRLVRGNEAWAAVMLRRDTGDSVFKAKLPRFRW